MTKSFKFLKTYKLARFIGCFNQQIFFKALKIRSFHIMSEML